MTNPCQVILRRYPDGAPQQDDFELTDLRMPSAGEGEVLVEVTHLSMDPLTRVRMQETPTLGPRMPLGQCVDSRGLGRVIASRHPAVRVGDHVFGDVGWRTHAVLAGDKAKRLDLSLGPPHLHLSVLASSGLTAFFSIHVVGAPKAGETVLIAPAAGAVGSLAGQIAKRSGAQVVGIGSGDQCRALTEDLGFDAAIDHRDLEAGLARHCPAGVDVFLDGVGGGLHDAVLGRLNPHARVILLGFISGYTEGGPPRYGAALPILLKRARMEGFLLGDWQDRFSEAEARLSAWVKSGEIRPVESIWEGLAQAPAAFSALFGDARPGKQIVRIDT